MEQIFTIDAGTLRTALKRVRPTKSRTIPQLGNIEIFGKGGENGMVRLRTIHRDGKKFARVVAGIRTAETEATENAPFRFALPAETLERFAGVIAGDAVFSLDSVETPGVVRIEAAGTAAEFTALPRHPFPEEENPEPDAAFFNQSPRFLDRLAAAAGCASKDDDRRALTCVCFALSGHDTRFVGTDGKYLVRLDGESALFPADRKTLIGPESFRLLKNAFSGRFAAEDDFRFSAGETRWTIRRGDVEVSFHPDPSNFPDWDAVIPPKTTDGFSVAAGDLADLLRRIGAAKAEYARFGIEGDTLTANVRTDGNQLEISALCPVADLSESARSWGAFFDPERLKKALLAGSRLRFHIHPGWALSPLLAAGECGEFVIMPLRLSAPEVEL